MFDSSIHHRKSIRLPGYDYSQPGSYFVTIVTQGRLCLFGNIADGKMALNDAGKMIEKYWFELSKKFDNVVAGKYAIMPDHFHGIITISEPQNWAHTQVRPYEIRVRADPCVRPKEAEKGKTQINTDIPRIVQWFKTMTTNEYIHGAKVFGWSGFDKRVWLRNYYEHIIHDDAEYARIWKYIDDNPNCWLTDVQSK